MGKVFVKGDYAWIIPENNEKPIKIIFENPKWQVEKSGVGADEKGILFTQKLTEEEISELKESLGIKPEDNKIGLLEVDEDFDCSNLTDLINLLEE